MAAHKGSKAHSLARKASENGSGGNTQLPIEFDDCRPQMASLIATVENEPDAWRPEAENALTEFYAGAFFYFDAHCFRVKPKMRKTLVRRVGAILDDHPKLLSDFAPTFSPRTFIAKLGYLLDGQASSLMSAACTRIVLSRISQHPSKEVRESLFLPDHQVFRRELFTLPDNSIYPSFYAANAERVHILSRKLRQAYKEKNKDLSSLIFNDNGKGPNFFKLMKEGAGVVQRGNQEWTKPYRFTRYKAQWLYEHLALFCGQLGIECDDFQMLFTDRVDDRDFRTGGLNFSLAMPLYANDLHPLYVAGKLPVRPILVH